MYYIVLNFCGFHRFASLVKSCHYVQFDAHVHFINRKIHLCEFYPQILFYSGNFRCTVCIGGLVPFRLQCDSPTHH